MREPAVTLLEDHAEFSGGDAERHSLRADLEPEPYKAGNGGHTLVGRKAVAQPAAYCLEVVERLARARVRDTSYPTKSSTYTRA